MKILIISHTPISTQNNMGKTLNSMFASFSKNELCQLYIYPSYPDGMYCSSFYRVTDKDVLKSKNPGGEVSVDNIHDKQTLYEYQEDEAFYRNIKNKGAFRRLARDLMWALANWHNSKLKTWLEKEKPTCIFLAPGPAKFIYRIALKISRELDIPIVTYICDEYYFVETKKTLLEKIGMILLKKTIEKTMKSSTYIIAISEEIKEKYSKKFGIPATVIMTGSQKTLPTELSLKDLPTSISYFGNIRINRNISLASIGYALDNINRKYGKEYVLNIYTSEKDTLFLSAFDQIKSIELKGFFTGEAFETEMNSSDILLHVEAFDSNAIDRVRHSVSTKIADSLASGIPLFAYGPEEISSIRHLIRYESACCVTSECDLEEKLYEFLNNKKQRVKYVSNALEAAKQWHCAEANSYKLYLLMEKV